MAVFAYKAWDLGGRRTSGTLVAGTGAEGRSILRQKGLRIEHFAPARLRGDCQRRHWTPFISRARREERVAELARMLALLLRSGVTLAEAFDVLIAQATGGWQVVLRDVGEALDGGTSFADATGRHPNWFGDVFAEAVRVGEQTGTLDIALANLAEHLKERQSLAACLKTAAVYPAILLTVATGVVLFLMTFVIPQLLTVLAAGGQQLPASTMLLKGVSDLLLNWWPVLIAVVVMAALATMMLLRTERGKRSWHRTLLRLPLVGVLIRKALIARFAQQMSMMLDSGVPFLEAVGIVRRTAGNVVLAAELESVELAVEAGSDIAPTLESSRIFPPLVARLVAIGQNSGELIEVLGHLRTGYEAEVRLAVTRFTAALEPLLIIVMAGVVGFIVFATLMPILQATRMMG